MTDPQLILARFELPAALVGLETVGWVRRVYYDRRYADGVRHYVGSRTEKAARMLCGRLMQLRTPAKVTNGLVPSPDSLRRADIATCTACARILERRQNGGKP